MDISSSLWSRILGLFRYCGVVRGQAREDPQDEGYQHSALHSGPFIEYISAQRLNELSKTPSVSGAEPYSSNYAIGDLHILEEIVLEHGEDTVYLLQRDVRDEKELPGTGCTIKILWFEHYKISWGEMARTRIGEKLLVEWGMQHPQAPLHSQEPVSQFP